MGYCVSMQTKISQYASSKKVMLSFKDIEKITSTSGSDVYSTNTIEADALRINNN